MSLSDHRYTARIAPTSTTAREAVHNGQTIIEDNGQRLRETIGTGCLTWPLQSVPVLIDHDENQQIGFVTQVVERDGWYEATFVVDLDRELSAAAVELLRVGTPVSLGAQSHNTDDALADLGLGIKRHTEIVLEEVSILVPPRTPAYRGAKVTQITERGTARDRMRERQERELAQATPKPPTPAAPSAPTRATTTTPTIPQRTPSTASATAQNAELERRIDWLEQHGYPIDMATVVENLQAELGHPSIDRTLARHRHSISR